MPSKKQPDPASRAKPTTDEARVLAHMIRLNNNPMDMKPVVDRFGRALTGCALDTYASLNVSKELQPLIEPIVHHIFGGAFVLGYLVAESERPAREYPEEGS